MEFEGRDLQARVLPNVRVRMEFQLEAPEPVRMNPKAKAGPKAGGHLALMPDNRAKHKISAARSYQKKRLMALGVTDPEELARRLDDWQASYQPRIIITDPLVVKDKEVKAGPEAIGDVGMASEVPAVELMPSPGAQQNAPEPEKPTHAAAFKVKEGFYIRTPPKDWVRSRDGPWDIVVPLSPCGSDKDAWFRKVVEDRRKAHRSEEEAARKDGCAIDDEAEVGASQGLLRQAAWRAV